MPSLPRGNAARGIEHLDAGTIEMGVLGEVTAENARKRLAVEQPKDVARHLIEPRALGELGLDVRPEGIEHVEPRWWRLV